MLKKCSGSQPIAPYTLCFICIDVLYVIGYRSARESKRYSDIKPTK